ncbi:DUF4168 domain-containing protein [Salipiger abyssi]|uniref:DUF4168 domain-containing protein n=1 Tax=Salipiger abyssi TaxID=1250539 RepID=UPI001A8E02D3|nr:DUF4168 domain-containing protein [Salipiger abyssi]MBN9888344.1 DUF4168 domain-containing protein [Salipiger abyssi]
MKLNGTLLKSTIIAALIAAPVAPVMAQTAETAPEAQAQTAPAADFSEDQLSSFVDAALQVQAVQKDYMTQIEAAAAEDEKKALIQEANTEMTAAVEETEGMDVTTYNRIGQAAQSDPELNERILAMVETRQRGEQTMTE